MIIKYLSDTMTDNFYKLLDSKYDRVYRGNYDERKGVDQIMRHSEICGPHTYFDKRGFEYTLYRHIAAAMRVGPFDMRKDTLITIMCAAFYVLEVKGTDRYIEVVLTVLSNLRDDNFFTYSKRDRDEYVFTAAQIAGVQATAYALAKLNICQRSDGKGMTL